MALLDILIPNFAADAVAVFDDEFNQVFSSARPIKASVAVTSKTMEHPVEDGSVITDHRVIEPVTIELALLLPSGNYRAGYQQIRQLYFSGRLLTVQTKAASYQNMLISEMPHTEESELFDTIPVALKLRQVNLVSAQYGKLPASKVKNKSAATTTNRGQIQGKTATPAQAEKTERKASVLKKILKRP